MCVRIIMRFIRFNFLICVLFMCNFCDGFSKPEFVQIIESERLKRMVFVIKYNGILLWMNLKLVGMNGWERRWEDES